MPEDIVVVGAGGFGRETLDVIEAINAASTTPIWRVVGVVDDGPAEIQLERLAARGYKYLGATEAAVREGFATRYLLGVGSPAVKRVLSARFDENGWNAATVIHPSASIGSIDRIGEGSVVCGGVQLSTNTRLGRHVHVNPNATIGHDAVLEDFVSVNPGAVVSGEVTVESGALIGAGAVILQGLQVGARSLVGASACVIRDVAEAVTVKGVPAR